LRPLSLRNKLLLFAAALVLVPGVLLTWIAERRGRASLQQVIGGQLAREAGHTADRLSALLDAERETLANFAQQDLMREVRVADIDKRISMALATLRDGNPTRLDYFVVDATDEIVASSDPRSLGPLPAWARALFADSRGAEGFYGPAPIDAAGAARVVMTTQVLDPDERPRVLGTLVGLFDWERLTRSTADVREDLAALGIAADVLVSRSDGEVLGGSRSSGPRDPPWSADLSDIARGTPRAGHDYTVDLDADLIIGRASLGGDLPDWKVLVVEPRALALAPARRLSQRLALTMGLALLVALGLAALAARRVVRPLSELTTAIRGLSHGNASRLRVPVRTDDELGTMAAAFNDMASQLDRTQAELVEAEKFAFVGELAAGVAHEIRTALGVLGTSAQILERSLPSDTGSQTTELAQMIRAEVGRLGGVVDDLLRDRPLELEALRISEPLARAVEFVGPQAREKGIEITSVPAADEPELWCEAELMYQVAVNLLVNAMHALGDGGRIEARVLDEDGGYGGFEVTDDGPGIPVELRDRIFQPFVTAQDGGVGLGLTFVKRVVHDHRGLASVESEGRGTRVRIRIPIAAAPR